MDQLRYTRTMDIAVLTVMALYFFVATTHIFFISQQRDQLTKQHVAGNSIFKRKTEVSAGRTSDQTLLKRPDKSTFEEKNSVTDVLNSVGRFFILLFILPLSWQLRTRFYFRLLNEAALPRHTFLSLQIIRI